MAGEADSVAPVLVPEEGAFFSTLPGEVLMEEYREESVGLNFSCALERALLTR